MDAALADPLLTQHCLVLSQASALYSSSSGRVTLQVFVFATFRCSDGRTAERVAAQVDCMVESRLLHGDFLVLSPTLSSTVTNLFVFHVDCAALVPHTRVKRHSAFRLRAHGKRHSAPSAHKIPVAIGNAMPATFADAATQLSFAEFSERCNLFSALPPRPQPSPTPLLEGASQTSPHSAASAEASTQLPLTEFFIWCMYSKGSFGSLGSATVTWKYQPVASPTQPHPTSGRSYADLSTQRCLH